MQGSHAFLFASSSRVLRMSKTNLNLHYISRSPFHLTVLIILCTAVTEPHTKIPFLRLPPSLLPPVPPSPSPPAFKNLVVGDTKAGISSSVSIVWLCQQRGNTIEHENAARTDDPLHVPSPPTPSRQAKRRQCHPRGTAPFPLCCDVRRNRHARKKQREREQAQTMQRSERQGTRPKHTTTLKIVETRIGTGNKNEQSIMKDQS